MPILLPAWSGGEQKGCCFIYGQRAVAVPESEKAAGESKCPLTLIYEVRYSEVALKFFSRL